MITFLRLLIQLLANLPSIIQIVKEILELIRKEPKESRKQKMHDIKRRICSITRVPKGKGG